MEDDELSSGQKRDVAIGISITGTKVWKLPFVRKTSIPVDERLFRT